MQNNSSDSIVANAPQTRSRLHSDAHFRILLVDDSEADRILTVAFLKHVRCLIDVAGNGKIAVDILQSRSSDPYDLVLMDFEMPVMTGREAVREIRRIEKESGAPATAILGLTAHTIANVAAQAYEAGFTGLLSKPLRREKLVEAVVAYGCPAPDTPPSNPIQLDNILMDDLAPAYLEKRRVDLFVYATALETGDFAMIRKLAHNMKGTGAGYGFPRLTELGDAIETAALRSDVAAIREHLQDFALCMESIYLPAPEPSIDS